MLRNSLTGLYAITDPQLMGADLISKSEQAILAGVNILQYRNKMAPLRQQEQEALELAQLCKKHNVLFLINDNVELAIKVNADGVHLGQSDTDLLHARKTLGQNKIIGITCHNKIDLAIKAEKEGADYVAFGRFFNSQTKPATPAADLSLINQAKKLLTLPIVAIGGITQETASQVLQQGADMIAVIHAIFGQSDIFNATRQFIEIIDSP